MALRNIPWPKTRRRYYTVTLLILNVLLAGTVMSRLPGSAQRNVGPARNAVARSMRSPYPMVLYLPVVASSPSQPGHRIAAPTPVPPEVRSVPLPPAGPAALQAKIEIVWPHDGASLREAQRVNITAYLMDGDGKKPLPCHAQPVVRLWRTVNAAPAQPIAVGQKRMFSGDGQTFPVWDFNDVDVDEARDPANRILFYITVDDVASRHNVWVHAVDARTVYPRPDVPPGVTEQRPEAVEARLQILWPHEGLPPDQAGLANLTAYLFDAQTGRALAPAIGWSPEVRLHWSLNNEADRDRASSAPGQARIMAGGNGLSFLVWDFNDIDISPAHDSLNRLHFWVTVDGVITFSNIWTHGTVAPTVFPQADVLNSCD